MKCTRTIIGVADVARSFNWYRSLFGQPASVPAHDDFGQVVDTDGVSLAPQSLATSFLEKEMPSDRQHKANNALGVCFIALLFLAETVVAHQHHPSPASPLIWSFLAAVALGSLIYWLRFRNK
jgi:hypothetical protein